MDLRDALLDAMRTWRTRRISRSTASRLIAGGSPGPEEYRGLRTLLDAAKAPPAPGELAGEREAVAGFATAHRTTASPSSSAGSPEFAERPDHMRVRGTVRALGVKIAAVAGALAISGTALAATTGHLPDAAQRRAHDVLGVPDARPAVERVKPRPTPYLAPSSPARQPAPAGTRIAPPASATPAPTASLPELCRLWLTPPGGAHTVNPTGHRALRAAAGSEKNISSYCATLLNPPTTSEAPPPGGDLPPSPAAPEPPAGDGGHTNDGGLPPATPFPEPTDAPDTPDTPAAGSAG